MNVFTFVFLLYTVLQTSANPLKTTKLTKVNSTRFEEKASVSFIFFATGHFRINVNLNKRVHVFCQMESNPNVTTLRKLEDGIEECRLDVTPFEYYEIRFILQRNSSFMIEDPSGVTVESAQSPLEVEIAVGRSILNSSDENGTVYVTRKVEDCPNQPEDSAVPLALIGVVVVLSLLLVLAVVVCCILYLLVPPETIRRVLFRSGGNDPGCTSLPSRIGQKDAQDTPSPPPRPINTHNSSETCTPLAEIPSVPLATTHQNDARHSNHDDGYDPLHDPNYDYIEANVVRPVDRAILDQELAGANPKWKQPPGGFRKISDPQTTGFRKLSDTPAPNPAAATPGHFQPYEDDEYVNLGPGFPPPQQHGPRGYRGHY